MRKALPSSNRPSRPLETNAYLGLGSNLGDREANLAKARALIGECSGIEIQDVSSIYETEPWPNYTIEDGRPLAKEPQENHLNQVICIRTRLSAEALLGATQTIETGMGKEVKKEWGARNIDIDLLLYGRNIIQHPNLILPHRFLNERQFVLVPLVEIAPELKDPRTGREFKTILADIKEQHVVKLYKRI